MSKAFKDWSMEMIRQCIKDCVRPVPQRSNTYVKNNDPYGLCLNVYKSEKGHNAPLDYRTYLLSEMHNAAQRLLKILKDPIEFQRCVEIIEKTKTDHRAIKQYKNRGVENIDMFADDFEL